MDLSMGLKRILRKTAVGIAKMVMAAIVLIVVSALWLNATMAIWYNFGDLMFGYWLIACALSVAIALVASW